MTYDQAFDQRGRNKVRDVRIVYVYTTALEVALFALHIVKVSNKTTFC